MDEPVNGSSSKADVLPWTRAGWTEVEGGKTSAEESKGAEGRLDEESNSWLSQYLEGIIDHTQSQNYSNSSEDAQGQGECKSIITPSHQDEAGSVAVEATLPSGNVSLESLLDGVDQFVDLEMSIPSEVEPLYVAGQAEEMIHRTCNTFLIPA